MEAFIILPLELFKKSMYILFLWKKVGKNILNCSTVLLTKERRFKGLTDDLLEFLMALSLYDLWSENNYSIDCT